MIRFNEQDNSIPDFKKIAADRAAFFGTETILDKFGTETILDKASTAWERIKTIFSREEGEATLGKIVIVGILAASAAVGAISVNGGNEGEPTVVERHKITYNDYGTSSSLEARGFNTEHPDMEKISTWDLEDTARGNGKLVEYGTQVGANEMSDGSTELELLRDPNNDNG